MLQERMDTADHDDHAHGIDHIEKFLEQNADIEAAVTTADTGFSVYDDLRADRSWLLGAARPRPAPSPRSRTRSAWKPTGRN
jgi:hypothetical protein